MEQKRVLALDVGDVRIGLAVSDPFGWTAQGLETYTRTGDEEKDAGYIRGVAARYAPVTLLFGLPRMLSGEEGVQAQKVRAFAEKVLEGFEGEHVFWDERLSTAQVERMLISADVSRAKRRRVVDKLAASVILQGYLDAKS